MTRIFWLLLIVACHDDTRTNAVTIPTASQSSSAIAPVPVASSAAPVDGGVGVVAFDKELHFKSGASGRAGDVDFTVRMLPKLIVSGPQPEIEQAQIEVSRGKDHATLHVDTRQKTAEWSGVVFELGYADVYHDDIVLTLHKK